MTTIHTTTTTHTTTNNNTHKSCATALEVSQLPGSILGFVEGKVALALLSSSSLQGY